MVNFSNDLAGLVFDYEYTGGNDPEGATGAGPDGDPILVADPPPPLVPDVIVFPDDGGGCNLFNLDDFVVLVQVTPRANLRDPLLGYSEREPVDPILECRDLDVAADRNDLDFNLL